MSVLDFLNNRPTIYNQSQAPNQTGNFSLTLNSNKQLVVLALRVLLSNKTKSHNMLNVPLNAFNFDTNDAP